MKDEQGATGLLASTTTIRDNERLTYHFEMFLVTIIYHNI
jgi:hypothetical protein